MTKMNKSTSDCKYINITFNSNVSHKLYNEC